MEVWQAPQGVFFALFMIMTFIIFARKTVNFYYHSNKRRSYEEIVVCGASAVWMRPVLIRGICHAPGAGRTGKGRCKEQGLPGDHADRQEVSGGRSLSQGFRGWQGFLRPFPSRGCGFAAAIDGTPGGKGCQRGRRRYCP